MRRGLHTRLRQGLTVTHVLLVGSFTNLFRAKLLIGTVAKERCLSDLTKLRLQITFPAAGLAVAAREDAKERPQTRLKRLRHGAFCNIMLWRCSWRIGHVRELCMPVY